MAKREETCETCKFFLAGEICCRYPPSFPKTNEQQAESIRVHSRGNGIFAGWFPEVSEDDWCGEYKAAAAIKRSPKKGK